MAHALLRRLRHFVPAILVVSPGVLETEAKHDENVARELAVLTLVEGLVFAERDPRRLGLMAGERRVEWREGGREGAGMRERAGQVKHAERKGVRMINARRRRSTDLFECGLRFVDLAFLSTDSSLDQILSADAPERDGQQRVAEVLLRFAAPEMDEYVRHLGDILRVHHVFVFG